MTLQLHSCIRLFSTTTAVKVANSRMQLCSSKVIISVIFKIFTAVRVVQLPQSGKVLDDLEGMCNEFNRYFSSVYAGGPQKYTCKQDHISTCWK